MTSRTSSQEKPCVTAELHFDFENKSNFHDLNSFWFHKRKNCEIAFSAASQRGNK